MRPAQEQAGVWKYLLWREPTSVWPIGWRTVAGVGAGYTVGEGRKIGAGRRSGKCGGAGGRVHGTGCAGGFGSRA